MDKGPQGSSHESMLEPLFQRFAMMFPAIAEALSQIPNGVDGSTDPVEGMVPLSQPPNGVDGSTDPVEGTVP